MGRFRVSLNSTLLYFFFSIPTFAQEHGHFHHVHMNVSNIENTRAYYQKVVGIVPIDYADKKPALLMERSFILLNEVAASDINNHLMTGLIHIGWSGVDGKSEFEWLKKQGITFYTPLSPLGPDTTYMYFYGPDREVIEIYDLERHHRFNHIHVIADNPEKTATWFDSVVNPVEAMTRGNMGNVHANVDGVGITVFPKLPVFTPKENTGDLQITDGSHLDHIAFSFRDLDSAYARIKELGSPIIQPISTDEEYGFRHFFSRAPNGILVEFVEAKPWPQAAWE